MNPYIADTFGEVRFGRYRGGLLFVWFKLGPKVLAVLSQMVALQGWPLVHGSTVLYF